MMERSIAVMIPTYTSSLMSFCSLYTSSTLKNESFTVLKLDAEGDDKRDEFLKVDECGGGDDRIARIVELLRRV